MFITNCFSSNRLVLKVFISGLTLFLFSAFLNKVFADCTIGSGGLSCGVDAPSACTFVPWAGFDEQYGHFDHVTRLDPTYCAEICNGNTACVWADPHSTSCGNCDHTPLPPPPPPPPSCGDGNADEGETCQNCPQDTGGPCQNFCGCINSCEEPPAGQYPNNGYCTRTPTQEQGSSSCGLDCGTHGGWWCAWPDDSNCGGGGQTPQHTPIRGTVSSSTGLPIENVSILVKDAYDTFVSTTTNENGEFLVSDFVLDGVSYSVRLPYNIANPQTAPIGYKPYGKTTNNSHSYNIIDNQNQPLNSVSYEAQDSLNNQGCADASGSTGCDFVFDLDCPTNLQAVQACNGATPQITFSWSRVSNRSYNESYFFRLNNNDGSWCSGRDKCLHVPEEAGTLTGSTGSVTYTLGQLLAGTYSDWSAQADYYQALGVSPNQALRCRVEGAAPIVFPDPALSCSAPATYTVSGAIKLDTNPNPSFCAAGAAIPTPQAVASYAFPITPPNTSGHVAAPTGTFITPPLQGGVSGQVCALPNISDGVRSYALACVNNAPYDPNFPQNCVNVPALTANYNVGNFLYIVDTNTISVTGPTKIITTNQSCSVAGQPFSWAAPAPGISYAFPPLSGSVYPAVSGFYSILGMPKNTAGSVCAPTSVTAFGRTYGLVCVGSNPYTSDPCLTVPPATQNVTLTTAFKYREIPKTSVAGTAYVCPDAACTGVWTSKLNGSLISALNVSFATVTAPWNSSNANYTTGPVISQNQTGDFCTDAYVAHKSDPTISYQIKKIKINGVMEDLTSACRANVTASLVPTFPVDIAYEEVITDTSNLKWLQALSGDVYAVSTSIGIPPSRYLAQEATFFTNSSPIDGGQRSSINLWVRKFTDTFIPSNFSLQPGSAAQVIKAQDLKDNALSINSTYILDLADFNTYFNPGYNSSGKYSVNDAGGETTGVAVVYVQHSTGTTIAHIKTNLEASDDQKRILFIFGSTITLKLSPDVGSVAFDEASPSLQVGLVTSKDITFESSATPSSPDKYLVLESPLMSLTGSIINNRDLLTDNLIHPSILVKYNPLYAGYLYKVAGFKVGDITWVYD